MKKLKKRKSGQAVIEFVFVLGLYFSLLGFMFSGFQLMHSKMIADISAYTGARYATINSYSQVEARAYAEDILNLNAFRGTDTSHVGFERNGDYVTCFVATEISFLFPMIDPNNPVVPAKTKEISAQFTMRSERVQGQQNP